MSLFDTSKLSAPNLARFNSAMDKLFRYKDGVRSLRAEIEARHERGELVDKNASDGMIDYSRTRFNRMDGREQADYMKRLEAKRYYWINDRDGAGSAIPKLAFDACTLPLSPRSL